MQYLNLARDAKPSLLRNHNSLKQYAYYGTILQQEAHH